MKIFRWLLSSLLRFNSLAMLLTGLGIFTLPLKLESQIPAYKEKTFTVDDGFPQSSISDIFQDRTGYIWVATEDGLIRYDGYEFKAFQYEVDDPTSIRRSFVHLITEDREGNLWVYLGMGLVDSMSLIDKFDKKTERFFPFDNPTTVPPDINAYFYNRKKDEDRREILIQELAQFYPHPVYNSHTKVKPILKDAAGNFWILRNAGLTFIEKNLKPFHTIRNEICGNQPLNSNDVRTIKEINNEELLVGFSTVGGFNHLELNPLKVKKNPPQLSTCWATVKNDKDSTYWLGGGNSNTPWLINYDPESGYYYSLSSKVDSASRNKLEIVRSMAYESSGNLWIGGEVLLRYNEQTKRIVKVRDFGKACGAITTIQIVPTAGVNEIWVGTTGCGIFRLQKKEDKYQDIGYHTANSKHPDSLSINYINVIYPYNDNTVWIGTYHGGLNKFNRNTQKFEWFTKKKDGLPHNTIYGILKDDQGDLWMSTTDGIFEFEPDSGKVKRIFDVKDGLQSDEFNSRAYHKGKSKLFYFGGINGFTYFHPDSIKTNEYPPPPVVFNAFYLNGNLVRTGELPLKQSINTTTELSLNYDQNSFGFDLAALNFNTPEKNRYSYIMKGHGQDEKVQYLKKGERYLPFNGLSHGTYTLKVKGSNNDGVWSGEEKSIKIVIRPPLSSTWGAYVSYFLMISAIIYWFYQRRKSRKEKKKQEDLKAFKIQVYENITHDIKTPLTIIEGNANSIEGNERAKSLILQNSKKLENQFTQLVDVSKLESNKMKLNWIQGDVIDHLKYLSVSYKSLAEFKNIELTFYPEIGELIMDFDKENLSKIVSNLLVNAIKFTPKNGQIFFHAKSEKKENGKILVIKVIDNGKGINEKDLPNIFIRGYGENTGLGLTICKGFVDLMEGSLSVESIVNTRTAFTVNLPITNEAPFDKTQYEKEPPVSLFVDNPNVQFKLIGVDNPEDILPKLLIIEDNLQMNEYYLSFLNGKYKIVFALDGEEGIEIAKNETPDVIICDLALPKKGGFEVVSILKSNEITSLIPIIMITGKDRETEEEKAINKGVSVFLEKPFKRELLLAHLARILKERKQTQDKYGQLSKDNSTSANSNKTAEGLFFEEIIQLIDEHLSEGEFGVKWLSQNLKMNKKQLGRKIKNLTGISTQELIISRKFLKAKDLLRTTNYQIKEVAYESGFQDPDFFSRAFKKEFKLTPTEYRSLNS